MNREDFKKLSRIRVRESISLLRNGHFNGAYYLIGYSIEFALKAIISRKFVFRRNEFPAKDLKKTIDKIYTHDLTELFKASDLLQTFEDECKNNPSLSANWAVVQDWSAESRYEMKSENEARNLIQAITNRTNGILTWLTRYW